jgi:hypothetical protein
MHGMAWHWQARLPNFLKFSVATSTITVQRTPAGLPACLSAYVCVCVCVCFCLCVFPRSTVRFFSALLVYCSVCCLSAVCLSGRHGYGCYYVTTFGLLRRSAPRPPAFLRTLSLTARTPFFSILSLTFTCLSSPPLPCPTLPSSFPTENFQPSPNLVTSPIHSKKSVSRLGARFVFRPSKAPKHRKYIEANGLYLAIHCDCCSPLPSPRSVGGGRRRCRGGRGWPHRHRHPFVSHRTASTLCLRLRLLFL